MVAARSPRPAAGLLMEKELELPGHGARQSRAAVRGDPRRRQGVGQDRGHREPARQGRSPADRRRDGLHVLQGARPAGRQVARRGRQARRRARDPRAHAKARGVELLAAGRPRRRRRRSRPTRRRRRCCRSAITRSATAWASTSAPRRSRLYARCIADAKTVVWNGPMGVFEIDAVRRGHDRRGAGRGRRAGHDDHRRRRLGRRRATGGRGRPDHAHLDRRRRVARVPRRQELPGVAALPDKASQPGLRAETARAERS